MNSIASGLLVIDKPVGPTSHAVVVRVRKGTGIRKVGHTGTLDPQASGVLVLCLGQATRLSQYLVTCDKEYTARIRFGVTTDTYDSEGTPTRKTGLSPSADAVQVALEGFLGPQEQVPPAFSAVKVGGKRAYRRARAGEVLELRPRTIEVFAIELLDYSPPDLEIRVHCSSGTYVRSLAHDLGQATETGAYLAGLRRLRSGDFGLDQAVPLSELERVFRSGSWQDHLVGAREALREFPEVQLDQDHLADIRNGRPIAAKQTAQGLACAIAPDGELAAILRASEGGNRWLPSKVFVS